MGYRPDRNTAEMEQVGVMEEQPEAATEAEAMEATAVGEAAALRLFRRRSYSRFAWDHRPPTGIADTGL